MQRPGCDAQRSRGISAPPRISLFNLSLCFAAASAFAASFCSSASAGDKNPSLARVERVKDTDGSTWEVLIVPRFPSHAGGQARLHGPKNLVALPPMPSQSDSSAQEKTEKAAPAKENPAEIPKTAANEFGVEIVPRFAYPVHAPSAECCPPAGPGPHINPRDYVKFYNSIPFRRSEYVANPSYRHEATMEMLTGQLHPKVVAPPQPRPHHTLFPYEDQLLSPNSYYSYWVNSLPPSWGSAFASGLTPYAPWNDDCWDHHLFSPRPSLYYPPF